MELKSFKQTVSIYAITIILSILILIFVMELWRADLNIPFTYNGDSVFYSMTIKSMMENGWYLYDPYIGAPFGLYLQDFPMSDNFNYLMIKIISLFAQNYAVVLNLFYILTFPLTAVTSVFVLRYFKVSNIIAIVFALLYTFIPYHFYRGQNHLFLAAYYMIPIIILIVLWTWSEKPIFFYFNEKKKKFEIDISNAKALFCIVASLIIGSTGVYYAFFSSIFLIIAGLSIYLTTKNKYNLFSSLILIIIIYATVFGNIFPGIIYSYNNGPNLQVIQRSPLEAELYGMKIIHLLLPVDGHRIDMMSKITYLYNTANPPFQNENTVAKLGLIGSIGFLALITHSILKFSNINSSPNIFDKIAVLNLSAVLFATIGGFGVLFAFFVTPQIRGYNRLSIFIAFFSLFALALFLNNFQKKYIKTNQQKKIFYLFLILILFSGIFDQTTKYFIPPYAALKEDFNADREFVETIEKTVPENSMIFQLPYMAFPGSPSVNNLGEYELFRGYLHSNKLRWSYGVMAGRNGNWQQKVSEMPIDDFLKTISLAGFNGIYIDRNGFSDKGASIEAELTTKLNTKPIISMNNRLIFFNMFNFKTHNKYIIKS